MDTRKRYDELDGYRGLAALGIVALHAYGAYGPTYPYAGTPFDPLLRYLWGGVVWFFVLSGFLIFSPFAHAALRGDRPPPLGVFLSRRLRRLLPLYMAAIAIVWTLDGATDRGDLLAHLTFTHIYSARYLFSLIGPAWSLAMEVQYYLLAAVLGTLLCRAARRRDARRDRAAILWPAVAMLIALSAGYGMIAHTLGARFAEPALLTRAALVGLGPFAIGMALAIAAADSSVRCARPARWRWSGLAVLGLYPLLAWWGIPLDYYVYWPAAASAALVFGSTVLGERGTTWERAIASRPSRALGTLSYGIYLWHEPLIRLCHERLIRALSHVPAAFLPNGSTYPLSLAMLLSVTLAIATLTYRYIERPFLVASAR